LAACAAPVKPEPAPLPPAQAIENPWARADLDELLDFGADLASRTAAERAEVCLGLLEREKESPSTGVQLHLLVGRLLSETCGDAQKIRDGLDAIPADAIPDERVGRWLELQKEVLGRMDIQSKKLAVLERKQKSLQSQAVSKPPPKKPDKSAVAKEPTDSEARLLKDKLEAIRAMEKKLDETGEGN